MAAWPTAADLTEWLRTEAVEASAASVVEMAFDAADELLRTRIDSALLLARAAAAGIVTDPDDDAYDAAVLAAWCPSSVRQAILIRAAAIYTRRDSTNGTISFGEFATRVAKQDPDVDELMRPVMSVLAGVDDEPADVSESELS